jgi:hypothetical protein
MAYLVSAAMLRRCSFPMIARRWVQRLAVEHVLKK